MKRGSSGSIVIEATLSFSFFVFAFMVLLSFANLARTESIVQHAINQTARELSQYAYLIEKGQSSEEGVSRLTDWLGALGQVDHYSESQSTISEATDPMMLATSKETSEKDQVWLSVCSALVKKYLTDGTNHRSADEFLLDLSVQSGLAGVDFSSSSFLADGRTIHIVANYRVHNILPGFFQKPLMIRQVASTAAWVDGKAVTVAESSKWQLSDIERGRAWLEAIRQENPDIAVAPGVGVDLYENGNCTFVWSMNLFASSYRSDEQLNEEAIAKQLRRYIHQALEKTAALPDVIEMADGRKLTTSLGAAVVALQIIVPEEALADRERLTELARQLELEKGVTITWHYREKLNPEVRG